MTDPLIDLANAISPKSPAIRKFAQEAAARIVALDKPPPPPSTTRGGIGVQPLGQPVPAGTAGRYDIVVTDEPNVSAALAQSPPASRTLVYMAACDVNAYTNYGVSIEQAAANGWELLDAQGRALVNVGYPANLIGDVGDDGYRLAWLQHVNEVCRRLGADGVYIDDVLGDTQVLIGGGYPAKYPTRTAWQAAMAGFVEYVGDRLMALGWYVMVNASAFTPGDPNSNTPANDAAWWRMIGQHVSGLEREYWQQNPTNVAQVMTDDPAKGWLGQWAAWQTLPALARTLGCDFYALSYGSAATLDYIRASFLLTWDGKTGAAIAAGQDPPRTLTNPGQPTALAQHVTAVWTRAFERGYVRLDAMNGAATVGAA